MAVADAAGTLTPSATLTVTAPQPHITSVSIVGGNAVGNFTTSNLFDNTGSFTLQSSQDVRGPYVNVAAGFTGGSGTFQFTVPTAANATTFYRLIHN